MPLRAGMSYQVADAARRIAPRDRRETLHRRLIGVDDLAAGVALRMSAVRSPWSMRACAAAATAGLAWKATPRPAFRDHVEIVGAVADRQRFFGADAERSVQLEQASRASPRGRGSARRRRRRACRHWRAGRWRGSRRSRSSRRCAGEQREAAGDQAGIARHSRAWSATSVRPPGVSVMRSAITSSTTDERQALEQRDALAQRRLEGDLAAHRALGDRGDMRLQADVVRKFVDAFLADHGGIHVGDEQLLARGSGRLHDDVDRIAAERRAQSSASSRASLSCRARKRCRRQCRGRARPAPAPRTANAARGAGSRRRARARRDWR